MRCERKLRAGLAAALLEERLVQPQVIGGGQVRFGCQGGSAAGRGNEREAGHTYPLVLSVKTNLQKAPNYKANHAQFFAKVSLKYDLTATEQVGGRLPIRVDSSTGLR
jgi:hypothetical protein